VGSAHHFKACAGAYIYQLLVVHGMHLVAGRLTRELVSPQTGEPAHGHTGQRSNGRTDVKQQVIDILSGVWHTRAQKTDKNHHCFQNIEEFVRLMLVFHTFNMPSDLTFRIVPHRHTLRLCQKECF
jgi:hypothetical protein